MLSTKKIKLIISIILASLIITTIFLNLDIEKVIEKDRIIPYRIHSIFNKEVKSYKTFEQALSFKSKRILKDFISYPSNNYLSFRSLKLNSNYEDEYSKELIYYLVSSGLKVGAIDRDGNNLFEVALKHYDENLVNFFFENGADCYFVMNNDYAFFNTAPKIQRVFIKHGFDPNKAGDIGQTPLSVVITNSDTVLLKMLINKGLDLEKPIKSNLKNTPDYPPLLTIINRADNSIKLQAVEMLIEAGANINYIDPVTSENALTLAVKSDSFDVTKLLLEKGLDSNKTYHNSYIEDTLTPLMTAAYQGNKELFKLLHENGGDINYKSPNKALTVRSICKKYNSFEVLHYMDNEMGRSPELLKAESELREKINKILKNKKDYDRKVLSISNSQLLYISILNNWNDVIDLLLKSTDTNVNYASSSPDTPLKLACRKGRADIVKKLLLAGADPNYTGDESETKYDFRFFTSTPLIEAIKIKNRQIISLLFEYGATAEVEYAESNLVHAINNKLEKTANYLIENGAYINNNSFISPSETPPTILMKALDNEMYTTAKLLIEKGSDIYKVTSVTNYSVLNSAINNKPDINLITKILQNKVSPNIFPANGNTTLNKAIMIQNTKLVELLLNNGADPNISDKDFENSYICATSSTNQEIIELLEQYRLKNKSN